METENIDYSGWAWGRNFQQVDMRELFGMVEILDHWEAVMVV